MIGEEAETGGNVMLGPSTSRPLEPLDGAAALVPTHSKIYYASGEGPNANAADLLAKRAGLENLNRAISGVSA
jgi:hypothetical protein